MTSVAELEMDEITLVHEGSVTKFAVVQRENLNGTEYLGLIQSDALVEFVMATRTGRPLVARLIDAARTHWMVLGDGVQAQEVHDEVLIADLNSMCARRLFANAG